MNILLEMYGSVTVVLDDSGSIDDSQWERAIDVTREIVNSIDKCTVIVGHIEVTDSDNFNPLQEYFSATVALENVCTDTCIVLTDGYTLWPNVKPPFDVIVALIGDYSDTVPAWAKRVIVE